MLRNLLVHVDGTAAGRRRVSLAVDLAKRTHAQLSGLHVTPSPEVPPRYKPSRVAEVAATISGYLAADAQAAAAAFGEETKKCRAETSWHEVAGDFVEGICNRARYADLVILGQYECQGAAEAHPLPIAHSVSVYESGMRASRSTGTEERGRFWRRLLSALLLLPFAACTGVDHAQELTDNIRAAIPHRKMRAA
jgi:nucleotide-binding universal stress UspA family protein